MALGFLQCNAMHGHISPCCPIVSKACKNPLGENPECSSGGTTTPPRSTVNAKADFRSGMKSLESLRGKTDVNGIWAQVGALLCSARRADGGIHLD
jgi:hypothetical protein